MKYRKVICLLAFYCLRAWGNEYGDMPEVKAIIQGQPKDVAALIERIAECNHWGGEEPYDKGRAQEIAKAVEKAGCNRLDADEQAIKKKYKAKKQVADAIEQAKNLVM